MIDNKNKKANSKFNNKIEDKAYNIKIEIKKK